MKEWHREREREREREQDMNPYYHPLEDLGQKSKKVDINFQKNQINSTKETRDKREKERGNGGKRWLGEDLKRRRD